MQRLLRSPDGLKRDVNNSQRLTSSAGATEVLRVEWNVTGTMLATSCREGVVQLWKSNFKVRGCFCDQRPTFKDDTGCQ